MTKVLAFDPGATRCGFACLEMKEDELIWHESGIFGVNRQRNNKTEEFQKYRLRLISYWVKNTLELLDRLRPDLVVIEIVPAVGGGNFVVATQSHLAATVGTVILAMANLRGIPVEQIGATSVKKKIGGSNKATKVKVRNGVHQLVPATKRRKKRWRNVYDESDAMAIALTALGLSANV